MSDTKTTKELYSLYVKRFGECERTPYQAEYYRKWLELLEESDSNEEAEEKSKENGLYTAGAAAVAMDRVFANRQATEAMGWADVAELCEDIIQKIKADPYYTFSHSGLWADIQALKNGWLRTIEGFHRLFVDFLQYDDTRSEPERAMSAIAADLKMLAKPSADFPTLAALPQFRALIDCSDEYYKVFTDTVSRAAATGRLDSLPWSDERYKDEIEELWDKRGSLKDECAEWYSQDVKSPVVRLSPETEDGKYEFINLD